MPVATFSLEELLAELSRADEPDERYLSCRQWAERLHVPASRARCLLAQAHEQGKLEATRRAVPAIDGSSRPVPVYRFLLSKEG